MEEKILHVMIEKGLLNLVDTVIDLPFTKEILEYLNSGKLKPLTIDLYDDTKDPIDHIQTF